MTTCRRRETVGINTLPGGVKRYAYLVRPATTTDLSPEDSRHRARGSGAYRAEVQESHERGWV
jgi:uncharacterized protein (DUF885 family)